MYNHSPRHTPLHTTLCHKLGKEQITGRGMRGAFAKSRPKMWGEQGREKTWNVGQLGRGVRGVAHRPQHHEGRGSYLGVSLAATRSTWGFHCPAAKLWIANHTVDIAMPTAHATLV